MYESISWHKGLAYDSRSAIQQAGYLQVAKNILFEKDGEQALRRYFETINRTAVNAIHSYKRFRDNLLIGDSTYLRHRNATARGEFTPLGSSFANAIFTFREYKDFLVAVNGTDSVMFDEDGNLYDTEIANPTTEPVGAVGAAGNPNGVYALYVSYLLTFPNGHQYETGLSPVSDDVTVATEKISWSSIPICPYTVVSGTEPTIYRKLYRGPGTGGSLADIYLVTTIEDNTTTTYSDNVTDSQLAANGACYVDDYEPGPVFTR